MPRFRKKPIEVEARLLTNNSIFEIAQWCGGRVVQPGNFTPRYTSCKLRIRTPDSHFLFVHDGDWVLQDVDGDFYPCSRSVFEATYERVGSPGIEAGIDELREHADREGYDQPHVCGLQGYDPMICS